MSDPDDSQNINITAAASIPTKPSPAQATRSYMYLEKAGGSVMYEKDGNYMMDEVPPELVSALSPNDEENIEKETDTNANAVFMQGPLEPSKVKIDTWSGHETVPCNLCDDPKERSENPENDIAPLWVWVYNMMLQIADKVKEYKRSLLQRDVSCGEIFRPPGTTVDEALVSTKGTQSTLTIADQN